jgi:leucyl-tRNA synthetase
MSKTKLNVISPEEIIERYGADTMRMYILADNPPDRDQIWSEEGVLGVNRFMNRLWDTSSEAIKRLTDSGSSGDTPGKSDKKMRYAAHFALQKCIQAYKDNWQFNTAIARIMELLNTLRKEYKSVSIGVLRETIEILLKLVAPISPHITEELWERTGHTETIFNTPMPDVDESAMDLDQITVVVQINGKLRGSFETAVDTPKEDLEKKACELEKIQHYIEGKTVRKVIVVPNKLVNIVAN